jgi:hypothetical protein
VERKREEREREFENIELKRGWLLVIGCPFLHSKLNKNLETCGGGSVNAQTHHLKHSQFTKQSAVAIEQFAYSPFAQDEEHVAALALTPSSLPDNVKSIYVSMFSAHIYMSTSARTNFFTAYLNILTSYIH